MCEGSKDEGRERKTEALFPKGSIPFAILHHLLQFYLS